MRIEDCVHVNAPSVSDHASSVYLSLNSALYFLLCLQASLSAEQKSEVSSITGMGFPSPRVARALLRCKEDKTKV